MKAIYFDLDNTLIDRNAAMDNCMMAFFEQYLPHYSYPKEQNQILLKDNWGYTPREEFCIWFITVYQPQNWTSNTFWLYIKKTIHQYIPPLSSNLISLLETLKKDYLIGILTNGSVENQTAKIQKTNLDDIFRPETIHISAQYNLSKPHPILFQQIITQTKLPPSKITYIGDDPIKDIGGAQQVGMKTVWVSHGREWMEVGFEPDEIIHHILNVGKI